MRRIPIAWILARCLAAVLAALFLGQAAAQPQGYPNKLIRIIIGYPPGGSLDIAARVIAAKLSERVGRPVIVENRPGAASIIGVDAIAKAAPDGYTIGLATSGALTITPNVRTDMPYNTLTDLAPIAVAFHNPLILVANPSFGAKNMAELIALAKADPGKIIFGSAGNGTTMHLAGALLNVMAGTELVHAPYKGANPAANDVVGGHIPIAILDVATTRDFINQGRLNALATMGAKRTLLAPDVPTIGESGVPGYAVTTWLAVIAPARMPPAIIRLLNSHLVAILGMPDARERFITLGLEPAPGTPEELGSLIKTELAQWSKLIRDSGIVVQ